MKAAGSIDLTLPRPPTVFPDQGGPAPACSLFVAGQGFQAGDQEHLRPTIVLENLGHDRIDIGTVEDFFSSSEFSVPSLDAWRSSPCKATVSNAEGIGSVTLTCEDVSLKAGQTFPAGAGMVFGLPDAKGDPLGRLRSWSAVAMGTSLAPTRRIVVRDRDGKRSAGFAPQPM